jgi:regulator of protease activity HflC (stomatin/prohibitin superfamily)
MSFFSRYKKQIFSLIAISAASSSSIYYVDPGFRAVIFHKLRGVDKEVIGEGLHFKVPYFEEPHLMYILPITSYNTIECGSSDLIRIKFNVSVTSRLSENRLYEIFTNYSPGYLQGNALSLIVNESVKSLAATNTSPELLTFKSNKMEDTLLQSIKGTCERYGLIIDNVVIDSVEITQ